jgi:hypothetical protein
LSFRPLILPENCSIKVRKAQDNRAAAWVSLDGATRFELHDGESITIKASKHRMGFVMDPSDNLSSLWAKRLTHLLNWNVRPYMKPLKKYEKGGPGGEDKDDGQRPKITLGLTDSVHIK